MSVKLTGKGFSMCCETGFPKTLCEVKELILIGESFKDLKSLFWFYCMAAWTLILPICCWCCALFTFLILMSRDATLAIKLLPISIA